MIFFLIERIISHTCDESITRNIECLTDLWTSLTSFDVHGSLSILTWWNFVRVLASEAWATLKTPLAYLSTDQIGPVKVGLSWRNLVSKTLGATLPESPILFHNTWIPTWLLTQRQPLILVSQISLWDSWCFLVWISIHCPTWPPSHDHIQHLMLDPGSPITNSAVAWSPSLPGCILQHAFH